MVKFVQSLSIGQPINHEFINYSLEDKKDFNNKKLFQGFPLLIEEGMGWVPTVLWRME